MRTPRTACVALTCLGLLGALLEACSRAPASPDRSVVRITGSDTMVNLVQAWAEHYRDVRPTVSVQVAGGGSGVGLAGLLDGTLDLAAASREIRAAERERARARFGTDPQEFTVAFDALAVYVHHDNPLGVISLEVLAEIYGEGGRITRWSQLAVRHAACASDDIIRVGRQNNSGTFAYFREVVLGRTRDYAMGSIDQSGSKDVVALVSRTPCAIGYSGMAFATPRVKILKIQPRSGTAPIGPSETSVVAGTYPLARRLYLYSSGARAPHVREFVAWVLSPAAQQIARNLRFVPVRDAPAGGYEDGS